MPNANFPLFVHISLLLLSLSFSLSYVFIIALFPTLAYFTDHFHMVSLRRCAVEELGQQNSRKTQIFIQLPSIMT